MTSDEIQAALDYGQILRSTYLPGEVPQTITCIIALADALQKAMSHIDAISTANADLAASRKEALIALQEAQAERDFARTALRAMNYCVLCARFPHEDGHGPECLAGQALEHAP